MVQLLLQAGQVVLAVLHQSGLLRYERRAFAEVQVQVRRLRVLGGMREQSENEIDAIKNRYKSIVSQMSMS